MLKEAVVEEAKNKLGGKGLMVSQFCEMFLEDLLPKHCRELHTEEPEVEVFSFMKYAARITLGYCC